MAPRQTSAAVAEPNDWQAADPGDWQDASPPPKPAPLAPLHVTPDIASDMFKAGVHAKMLGVTPATAYDQRDVIDSTLREHAADYDGVLDPTIANDVKAGIEGSILGLMKNRKLPGKVRNPGMMDKFVSGVSEMLADIPFYLAGGAAGGAAGSEVPVVGNVIGAAAGAFAIPAAMREALVQGIQHGEVQDLPDLLRRSASVTLEATKGAVVGAATELAGGIPVGKFLAKSPMTASAVKGLYQATALTTAADLMEGHVPTAQDFAGNAALIVPLNLITHGVVLRHADAKQALLDVYAKNGKTPQESAATLGAQPPVKPEAPGLRPAIETSDGHVEGEAGESHADVAERAMAKRAVSMESLEKDPTRADRVLENPAIHDQDVIDRAWELKRAEVDAGAVEAPKEGEKPLTIEDLYDRNAMKSGRGFVTPDGQFLSRMEARKWMKDNEPDTHELWLSEQGGDKQAELSAEAYVAARNRAQARAVAEGDAVMAQVSPENASRLAAFRTDLNKIKAGDASEGYGKEVIRTLFAGQRDTRIAATTQLRDSLKKLIPDFHDQEALSILRDYKDRPDKLAADLEQIRESGSERERALIPSIERAINPSPALLEADQRLTDYYTHALSEGQQLGFMESTIDPANYSPHILTRILDGEKPSSTGRAVMSQTTPFAKERSYPTILDAIATGKIDARTVNALDALSVYGERHATVVATKLLATELRNTELGKYGTQDKHPEGWVELAPGQGAFRSTRVITDAEGDPHMVSQSLYVPKDVADAMKPLFESGLAGTKLAPLLKAQGYVKALELGLSLFHVKALTITAMNNMGMTNFVKGMASSIDEAAEREAAADGLTTAKTSTPYEAYEGLKDSSLPTGLDKLANAPVIKQIDAAFKGITEYTFGVVQRKFKLEDFSRRSAAWLAKNPEATNEQYFTARRSIAKEVNSAYGGLNWDVLGTGKAVRDVSRLFLLAPDWTFSNVLTAKYAFEGGPAGSAARLFWARSFATGFAMTAAASIAIGGKYDPSDTRHIDQVYLGTDAKGKEMYANWFFAGAPKDAMTLVKRSVSDTPLAGTAEFIVSKASPLLSTLGDVAYNKRGGSSIPVRKTADTSLEQTGEAAKYAAGRVVPITGVSAVKTVSDALTDPEHEYSYTDLLELAADALGSPTTHTGAAGGGGSTAAASANRFQQAGRGSKSRFTIKGGR